MGNLSCKQCVGQCFEQKHMRGRMGQGAECEELDRHRFETRTHPSPALSRVASASAMAWPRQICANSTCIVQQCNVTSRDVMHIRGNRQGMRKIIRLVQVQTPPSSPRLSSRRGRARSRQPWPAPAEFRCWPLAVITPFYYLNIVN